MDVIILTGQDWVNRHPIVFVIALFCGIWTFNSFVFSRWGGWARLAERYRYQGKFGGKRYWFQSAQFRWGFGAHQALIFGANSTGWYIAIAPIFPLLFHPPLFIPWTDVHLKGSKRILFRDCVCFELGRDIRIPIAILEKSAEK